MGCCGCESTGARLARRSPDHRRVLWLVLAINAAIFAGEYAAGWLARSTALQGDSLDSLGDALVYGLSLVVAGRALRARAAAALVKGGIQLAFALGVLAQALHRLVAGGPPLPPVMLVAAGLALAANATCLWLLTRYRDDDVNMRSVWLCSRNDVLGNAGVLLAAGLIAWSGWGWLDLLFGAGRAVLFLGTGLGVLRAAWPQFRAPRAAATR